MKLSHPMESEMYKMMKNMHMLKNAPQATFRATHS